MEGWNINRMSMTCFGSKIWNKCLEALYGCGHSLSLKKCEAKVYFSLAYPKSPPARHECSLNNSNLSSTLPRHRLLSAVAPRTDSTLALILSQIHKSILTKLSKSTPAIRSTCRTKTIKMKTVLATKLNIKATQTRSLSPKIYLLKKQKPAEWTIWLTIHFKLDLQLQ